MMDSKCERSSRNMVAGTGCGGVGGRGTVNLLILNNSALVVGLPVWTGMKKRKCLAPTGVRTPTVQSVACRSTDRATSAPSHIVKNVSKLQVEKGFSRAYI